MSTTTIVAVTIALAAGVTVVAHILDQLGSASALTRVGVRMTAAMYIVVITFVRFADAL